LLRGLSGRESGELLGRQFGGLFRGLFGRLLGELPGELRGGEFSEPLRRVSGEASRKQPGE